MKTTIKKVDGFQNITIVWTDSPLTLDKDSVALINGVKQDEISVVHYHTDVPEDTWAYRVSGPARVGDVLETKN